MRNRVETQCHFSWRIGACVRNDDRTNQRDESVQIVDLFGQFCVLVEGRAQEANSIINLLDLRFDVEQIAWRLSVTLVCLFPQHLLRECSLRRRFARRARLQERVLLMLALLPQSQTWSVARSATQGHTALATEVNTLGQTARSQRLLTLQPNRIS